MYRIVCDAKTFSEANVADSIEAARMVCVDKFVYLVDKESRKDCGIRILDEKTGKPVERLGVGKDGVVEFLDGSGTVTARITAQEWRSWEFWLEKEAWEAVREQREREFAEEAEHQEAEGAQ